MTEQKKREIIEEAFNYYHDRTSLTNKEEEELLIFVNELYKAITVTRCCKSDSEQFYCFNKKNKRIDRCINQCSTCKELKLMQ